MKRSLSSIFSYSVTKEFELIESSVILELTLLYKNILILFRSGFVNTFLSNLLNKT